ncbi:MAG TPA: CPBP family intramembrane glutamic endopeptidase, partial [Gemmatimonadaceae bacterium]|nr:CPBP family intramembrane glutamic endopeptidase [Gemmatimonadaceae bacterium]
MTTLIKRHPLASYFLLTIALSWGGILLIVLPGSIPAPPAEAERLFVAVYLAMLVGPSVAGLAICRITGRRPGIGARLRSWRAGGQWYGVALLAAPIAMGLTLLVLSLVSPEFVPAIISGSSEVAGPVRSPSVTAFLLMGLAVGIGAGLFEEIGWTGFAVPRMLSRHGILATGVGVGLVWGFWHFLAIWWGSA